MFLDCQCGRIHTEAEPAPVEAAKGALEEWREKFPVNEQWGHEKLENVLQGAAGLLDVIKGEWAESWSEWDQSVRNGITQQLAALASRRQGTVEGLTGEQLRKIAYECIAGTMFCNSRPVYSWDLIAQKLAALRASHGEGDTLPQIEVAQKILALFRTGNPVGTEDILRLLAAPAAEDERLREACELYLQTYADTQTHPTASQEANCINVMRATLASPAAAKGEESEETKL